MIDTYYLSPREFRRVVHVLVDVKKSVSCGIALGGSLAQRVLLPSYGAHLAGKPLYDIDLVLLEGSIDRPVVTPEIKKYFYVLNIVESKGSYYFGLIHKKTLKWVDLFAEAYPREYATLDLAGEQYPATSLESQILWMARDMLSQISKGDAGQGIHQKHLARLELLLAAPETDHDALEREFSTHAAYYAKQLPETVTATTAQKYCAYALDQGHKYTRFYDSWSKSRRESAILVTTNGVTLESPLTFALLLPWHIRAWLYKRLSIY